MSGMKVREAAQALGVRLDALYQLIWAGRLPAIKRDGVWLVDAGAVNGRLRRRTQPKGEVGARVGLDRRKS